MWMLPVVKLKHNLIDSVFMRFISRFFMIFAVFLCGIFYLMNAVRLGGLPTQEAFPEPPSSTDVDEAPEDPSYVYPDFGEVSPPEYSLYQKIKKIYDINSETVGWVTIPGTNIDYPVMQAGDNSYYLDKNYDRRYKFSGSIFLDYRNGLGTRYDLSQNSVLYGHNMNADDGKISGDMFAQLMAFSSYDFAKETPYIYFSTRQDQMIYQIFAVFYTDINFYYIDVDPSAASFNAFINEAKSRSLYNYSVPVEMEDRILTLSTCTYHYNTTEEQRFVVMAKLVTTDDVGAETVQMELNPQPKQPDFVE